MSKWVPGQDSWVRQAESEPATVDGVWTLELDVGVRGRIRIEFVERSALSFE